MNALSKLPLHLSAVTICLFVFCAPDLAAANRKTCTEAEEKLALDQADQLKDWNAVYRSFRRFAQCDDGAIAEGYSDTVGRLMAHDWKHFTALSKLAAGDKKFADFVLSHIDATVPSDELKPIETNARKSCPPGQAHLCKKILERTHSAIVESIGKQVQATDEGDDQQPTHHRTF
ncbi:MAG: hypothetical protein WA755_06150 [Candidatus Acidiferrales bacterium]